MEATIPHSSNDHSANPWANVAHADECPFRVILVTLTVRRSLPLFRLPDAGGGTDTPVAGHVGQPCTLQWLTGIEAKTEGVQKSRLSKSPTSGERRRLHTRQRKLRIASTPCAFLRPILKRIQIFDLALRFKVRLILPRQEVNAHNRRTYSPADAARGEDQCRAL
jgi:hypothetical protein